MTISPTDRIVSLGGVKCRVWVGTPVRGNAVWVVVHRIVAADPLAQAELERDLMEMLPLGVEVEWGKVL
jgi:hypothetical protein